ncbi:DUF4249 domain-containing protein [Algoriphagus mannitolivorans]|uniref:DUF4249 domain-containing protein n=1 Tax=Algoriphagus mannitolivorans TaxID=226504 RepID=UPI0003FDCC3C|nr:DUF4249 domain-containing protein [Algoriphagus mannitolivorans]
MQKQLNKILKFVFLLSVSWGCEQYLEVELPNQGPQLVLNAMMEKDTVKVYLTKSRSVLEGREQEAFDLVEGARVTLTIPNGTVNSLHFEKNDTPFGEDAFYWLPVQNLESDASYLIRAESLGLDPVQGAIKYPKEVPIKELSYTTIGPDAQYLESEILEFTLSFEDLPGKNFFEVSADYFGKSVQKDNHFYFGSPLIEPVNPGYKKDFGIYSGLLFDDALFKESKAEVKFRVSVPRNAELEFSLRFSHVTESYFRYRESVALQNKVRDDVFSQPVLVYSNLNNGMGVIQARNSQVKKLKLLISE